MNAPTIELCNGIYHSYYKLKSSVSNVASQRQIQFIRFTKLKRGSNNLNAIEDIIVVPTMTWPRWLIEYKQTHVAVRPKEHLCWRYRDDRERIIMLPFRMKYNDNNFVFIILYRVSKWSETLVYIQHHTPWHKFLEIIAGLCVWYSTQFVTIYDVRAGPQSNPHRRLRFTPTNVRRVQHVCNYSVVMLYCPNDVHPKHYLNAKTFQINALHEYINAGYL